MDDKENMSSAGCPVSGLAATDYVCAPQNIVVMGGSFNPPTIAHLRLMETAIKAVGAEKGIFIPVGGAYLKRKMRRSEDHIRLDESLRLDMLKAMCADRDDMAVSDIEIANPLLYTKDSLFIIADQNPGARIFFIAGADKIPMLGSFTSNPEFFDRFRIVMFSREGIDTGKMIREDLRLAPHARSFIHIDQPAGMDEISSTAVRKMIAGRSTKDARGYLHRDVWDMIRHLTHEDFPPDIEKFSDEYAFLANSFSSPILYDGLTFSCAESAFQASRCMLEQDRKRIAQADGAKAIKIAANARQNPGWDEEKLNIMEDILRAKFIQNPELARKLADTGNAVLTNGSNRKDTFWSKNLFTDRGENHLGRLLMKLRSEIQKETEWQK